MDKHGNNGICYYTFGQNGISSVPHGFFTRLGGVSPDHWKSLNLSTTGGDSVENVIENRRRIFQVLDRPVESIYDTWQVHGTKIINAQSPRGLENTPIKADGIITNNKSLTLFMRFADCVPLLFFDPYKKVIGIAHAGWKGTVNQIGAKMVKRMSALYGCIPKNISAGIGPSICRHHYLVKEDVLNNVKQELPNYWEQLISKEGDGFHLDLQLTNKLILENEGLTDIEISPICTACNTDEWFSHRAEHGATGRFGTFIALE